MNKKSNEMFIKKWDFVVKITLVVYTVALLLTYIGVSEVIFTDKSNVFVIISVVAIIIATFAGIGTIALLIIGFVIGFKTQDIVLKSDIYETIKVTLFVMAIFIIAIMVFLALDMIVCEWARIMTRISNDMSKFMNY